MVYGFFTYAVLNLVVFGLFYSGIYASTDQQARYDILNQFRRYHRYASVSGSHRCICDHESSVDQYPGLVSPVHISTRAAHGLYQHAES